MFKLGKDEDIDLEEDFLQEIFTVKKNVKGASVSTIPLPSNTRISRPPPQSVLTNRTNYVSESGQKNVHSTEFTKVKSASSNFNAGNTCPEHENFLNDINWDLGFEEDEVLNPKLPAQNKSLNSLNEKLSPTKNNCLGSANGESAPQTSFPVINGGHVATPPALAPKPSPWSANRSTRKRRFPGPAGLLPTQQSGSLSLHFSLDHLVTADTAESAKLNELNDSLLLSQISENPFESQPWLQMQEDLDLNGDDSQLLRKFNIAWVLSKASSKQLPNGKVPILILVIKSILEKSTEVSVVFKDETGEMPGTIHRKVFEEYEDSLVPGAVLLVRKVTIISPTSRKHYLNVTPTNVVCLYSSNPKRPKVMGPGTTQLRRQVREYALESLQTSETTTAQENLLATHYKSPTVLHRETNGMGMYETTNAKSHEPSKMQQTEFVNLKNQESIEADGLLSDEDLDKLFEDLNGDFFSSE